jgi:uncharacterized OsmC-like protein
MTSQEIKNLQAPLKEKYRQEPASAVITLHAQGKIGDAVMCSVATGKAIVEAGLHPATGGTGMLACSGDMLLQALVACAGVTLKAVATALEVNVTGGTITAEGDLDFKGTLGVSRDASVGFTSIRLNFQLEGDISGEQVETLKKLTERYCVIYQTLVKGVPVISSFSA